MMMGMPMMMMMTTLLLLLIVLLALSIETLASWGTACRRGRGRGSHSKRINPIESA